MTGALASLLAASLAAAPGPGGPPSRPGRAPATGLVRVEYVEPTDPAHRAAYERLRDRKVLEPFAEVLGAVRLPRPLTLRFAGCDGEVNAWYDGADRSITFCYEFVADIERGAEGAAQHGVPREDAVEGPIAFILLHESGHALFDLLRVPILGREEDAADQVAAYTLLRAGKGVARRALGGAAWMYKRDAAGRKLDESDFADVHGLDVQRFYNVLCMAYGSDPGAFGGLVERGYLPKDRAEGCADEYAQVGFAVGKLISRNLDPAAAARTRAKHKARWDAPAAPAPTPAAAPVPAPAAAPVPAPAAAPAPPPGKR
ncbi:MAG TPA: DUF4344 domain-containing metallopeptidase [Anaeromyxobacter sp.]|nr:DUF4344 domain-containing metallopeptidase [Anaeromyxobacter sp.]